MKKTVGSYLIIQITGCISCYIAEVVQEEPLILKVEETGPYARLKRDDFIIMERDSERIQDSEQEIAVLQEAVDRKHPLLSGLASLGVTSGKLHTILPAPAETSGKEHKP